MHKTEAIKGKYKATIVHSLTEGGEHEYTIAL